ncbi:MAG: DEAD/DEAH box helicase, partial [Apilactobacillus sp.]|nr:DEAD/DEAH box helicase [Apilactobacillus sp.]
MLSDEALKKHLKKWFGFNDFRSGQKEVIQSILDGKDTLGVLPTGTGKTLIYQYVGKMVDGMVIVVSPLISLMQDQVDRMRYLGEKQTVAITSNLSWVDRKRVIKNLNNYKYVYVSPEMLSNSDILDAFKQHKISLFVVDEAHCINQWGPDFRPEYLNLKDIIISLNHPTTLMLTATASNDVVLDIKEKIGLPNVETIKYSTNRPNIALAVDTF